MVIRVTKRKKYAGFTTMQVEKHTGVSARKLRWWDQQGLVRASATPTRKRWQRRRYTLQDIVCVLVVKTLREKGLSLQRIRESVKRVCITGVEQPLAQLRVACIAHTVVFKEHGKYFEPVSGQMVIEEALEQIRPQFERRRLAPTERAVERANRHYQEKLATF